MCVCVCEYAGALAEESEFNFCGTGGVGLIINF